jgi:hypothetical protein
MQCGPIEIIVADEPNNSCITIIIFTITITITIIIYYYYFLKIVPSKKL